jgi:LysM repeat protein
MSRETASFKPVPCVHSFALAVLALAALPACLLAQSLQGSAASLDVQNRIAREHDFTYIDTPARVEFFASQGWLVRVRPTGDFVLDSEVSHPFARPEVALFVRRLGAQYRAACGEQLVVTSLTRPTSRQPRNASDRSVHPTGMAVDLRYSRNRSCRTWLEGVLTTLERQGVLEATRERRPVHYHVAIFPRHYANYVSALESRQAARVSERLVYTVQRGDSLWEIARSHGTSVEDLQAVNDIDGSRIYAGQIIDVPVSR